MGGMLDLLHRDRSVFNRCRIGHSCPTQEFLLKGDTPLQNASHVARLLPFKHLLITGVAQLVPRSTPDRCVVGSSPTCGTEHFGFPPSAPRLGNQRPWYVQPRLCDWAYRRSRATYRNEKGIVSRWSVSS